MRKGAKKGEVLIRPWENIPLYSTYLIPYPKNREVMLTQLRKRWNYTRDWVIIKLNDQQALVVRIK